MHGFSTLRVRGRLTYSDLHVCLAEGEGLEPPSPFGQRFSSPLTAFSRNVANQESPF
jgi:hypothetical protein